MPYFWFRDAQSGEWRPLQPSAPVLALDPDGGALSAFDSADACESGHAVILSRDSTTGARFFLLTSRRTTRINGVYLASGIRQLADRDAIHLDGAPSVYFSAESAPVVEPFPGGAHPYFCARCRSAIMPGSPAVRCPGCATWHHASDELPCWSYSDQCICGYPTALDGGPRWTPEEL